MTREEFKEAVSAMHRLNQRGELSDLGLIDAVVILVDQLDQDGGYKDA